MCHCKQCRRSKIALCVVDGSAGVHVEMEAEHCERMPTTKERNTTNMTDTTGNVEKEKERATATSICFTVRAIKVREEFQEGRKDYRSCRRSLQKPSGARMPARRGGDCIPGCRSRWLLTGIENDRRALQHYVRQEISED